jgi:hypothetical protein
VGLQWRGIAVVLTILGNVIFFAVVFLTLDESARKTPQNIARYRPWLLCLVLNKGDKLKCAPLAATTGPSEASTMAVLIMLAMSGVWTVLFFGHFSILRGWLDFIKQKMVSRKVEFVSIDARGGGSQSRSGYEMYGGHVTKSPEPLLSNGSDISASTTLQHHKRSGSKEMELTPSSREAKYTSPALSFSTPRPPSAARQGSLRGDWDPQSTFARGDAGSDPYRVRDPSRPAFYGI